MAINIARRKFIAALGGTAFVWPLAARAQQGDRVRRVGVMIVIAESDPESASWIAAFLEGLGKLGWTVGRNLQIDIRWGISDDEQARAATTELLRLAPDVILANSVVATRAAQQATQTVPIVFTAVSEPVAQGFVASVAHPGGNTTGFSNFEPSVGAKWLALLKEIAPRVTRVAVMFSSAGSLSQLFYRSIEAAAPNLAVETVMAPVLGPAEIEAAMTTFGHDPGGGFIVLPDTLTTRHSKLIIDLAARYQLPVVYAFRLFAFAGGLMSYGPDLVDQFRLAAAYVDRILRGEKPGDLPVQQPTKFEFVVNLKTAKVLGLTVPLTLQAAADEVIE
jgi:putative ABC transport system substrate-binding protein